MEHFANPTSTVVVAKCCFYGWWCVTELVRVQSLSLDECIFHCLIASVAAVQAEDVRASFLFVGDLNGHHQEWLGSTTTNRHGIAAFQLVVGLIH